MTRFIFLVFGFLALAFFELSGGVDFSPAGTRIAAMETRQTSAEVQTARPVEEEPQDVVARAELNLVSFSDVTAAQTPTWQSQEAAPQRGGADAIPVLAATALGTATLQDATALEPVQVPASVVTDEAPVTATSPLQVASQTPLAPVRFEGSTARASSADVEAGAPLRRVNGDLVNLRAGPGTEHDVLSQLTRGQEVEVLGDNGAGWVRLRPVDGGPEGWMADFLLTRG